MRITASDITSQNRSIFIGQKAGKGNVAAIARQVRGIAEHLRRDFVDVLKISDPHAGFLL